MQSIDLLIACIRKLGGDDLEPAGANTYEFTLRGIPAFAYIQDGGRLRGSVFLDVNVPETEMPEAIEWAADQQPRACRVDAFWASESDAEGGGIRLLFERELDPESISGTDQLAAEAEALAESWFDGSPLVPHHLDRLNVGDPTGRSPTNAWLLMGSESSYPTADEIRHMRHDAARGIYESAWTAAKQTEPGDLLFFYFREPLKAIRFVARAADHGYFEDIGRTDAGYSGRQWWTHITPMVEVEPIPLDVLRRVTGDTVMLGRSGRYLRPEHAAQLAERAVPLRDDDLPALQHVLKPVVGRPGHPDPTTLNLDGWRQLASGVLTLEADVERLIVEPLMRMALDGHPDARLSKAYRIGPKIVDYVVLRDSRPVCAIEVKLRVRRSRTSHWSECSDFRQAANYSRLLGVPAILQDAVEIHLIPPGADEPSRTLSRSVFLDHDLATVRNHILDL